MGDEVAPEVALVPGTIVDEENNGGHDSLFDVVQLREIISSSLFLILYLFF
jgi:hypothetical protein